MVIPDTPGKTDSSYEKRKKHDLFCKRAGIEPVIGHLKSDHRLGRNFYGEVFGDEVNVMPAAAAYSFKRAMRLLSDLFERWLQRVIGKNLHHEKGITPLLFPSPF